MISILSLIFLKTKQITLFIIFGDLFDVGNLPNTLLSNNN